MLFRSFCTRSPPKRKVPVLSAPKKKDLSALKARLAKKAAASVDVPAPGQVIAPPEPEPAPASIPADIPAPGQSLPADVPAPGQVAFEPEPVQYEEPAAAAPAYAEPEAAAAAAPSAMEGDLYTGGQTFDVNDGLIADDGGGMPSRSGTGLALTALAGGILVGGMLGFFAADVVAKNGMKDKATAKAAIMLEEVKRVAETRKTLSVEFGDVVKQINKDPKAGSEALTAMLVKAFGQDADFPKVETLFGWQLSSLGKGSIKSTFDLYKGSNDLVVDMGFLAQYVNANAGVIAGRGPKSYGLVTKEAGAVMVEYVSLICGFEEAAEAEGDKPAVEPKPIACLGGKEKEATHVVIREAPGGATGTVEIGMVTRLLPAGAMYMYAIGDHPEENAALLYKGLAKRVEDRLDSMAKNEKRAIKALQAYGESPTTDDDSVQSDPPAE